MPQQIRLPDQTIGNFPDEWNDSQIKARISADFPDAFKTAPTGAAPSLAGIPAAPAPQDLPKLLSSHAPGGMAFPPLPTTQPSVLPPEALAPPGMRTEQVPTLPLEQELLPLGQMAEEAMGPTALPAEPVRPNVPLYPGRPVGHAPITASPQGQRLLSAPLRGAAAGLGGLTSPEALTQLGMAVAVPPLGGVLAAEAAPEVAGQAASGVKAALAQNPMQGEEALKGLAAAIAPFVAPLVAAHVGRTLMGRTGATRAETPAETPARPEAPPDALARAIADFEARPPERPAPTAPAHEPVPVGTAANQRPVELPPDAVDRFLAEGQPPAGWAARPEPPAQGPPAPVPEEIAFRPTAEEVLAEQRPIRYAGQGPAQPPSPPPEAPTMPRAAPQTGQGDLFERRGPPRPIFDQIEALRGRVPPDVFDRPPDQLTHDEARFRAFVDPLTRAPNRAARDVALKQQPGLLQVHVDLDGLKEVNDTYGHAAGDAFLVQTAERLKAAGLRVARTGGDEFTILTDNPERDIPLVKSAQREMTGTPLALPGMRPEEYPEGRGFSYGAGQTLEAADRALYENKAARRTAAAPEPGEGGPVPVEHPAGVPPPPEARIEPEPAERAGAEPPESVQAEGAGEADLGIGPSVRQRAESVFGPQRLRDIQARGWRFRDIREGERMPPEDAAAFRGLVGLRSEARLAEEGLIPFRQPGTGPRTPGVFKTSSVTRLRSTLPAEIRSGQIPDEVLDRVSALKTPQEAETVLANINERLGQLAQNPKAPGAPSETRTLRSLASLVHAKRQSLQSFASPWQAERVAGFIEKLRALNVEREMAARKAPEPAPEPEIAGAPPVEGAESAGAAAAGEQFPKPTVMEQARAAASRTRAAFRGPQPTFTRAIDMAKRTFTTGDLPTLSREAPEAADILKSLVSRDPQARMMAMGLKEMGDEIYARHGQENGFYRAWATGSDVNLEGTRGFWREKKAEVDALSPEEVLKKFPDSYSWMVAALTPTSKWQKSTFLKKLSTAVAAKDAPGVKEYLSRTFGGAANKVGKIVLADGRRGLEDVHNPAFQEFLKIYEPFAEEMKQYHLLAGHGTRAVEFEGKPFPYFPLQASREGTSLFERVPWKHPKAGTSMFRTGQAREYELGIGPLQKLISNDVIYKNGMDKVMAVLEKGGWLRPGEATMPRRGEETWLDVNPRGQTEKFTGRPISMAKIGKDGQIIPAKWGAMPVWLAKEMDPFLQPFKESEGFAAAAAKALGNAVTEVNLGGPTDAAFHIHNQLGGVVANIPIVGSNVISTLAQNAPGIKTFAVLAREIAAERIGGKMSPEFLDDVKTLAEVGALPKRWAKETYSEELSGQTGAEKITWRKGLHGLSPLIFGPKGMDVRARVVALRMLREAKPDATPAEIRDYVNHAVGRYASELEPILIQKLKGARISPFATAGRTFITAGVKRVAHPFGGESLEAVPEGPQRTAVAAMNFLRSPWAIPLLYTAVYHAYRGKDWWQEGSKFGTIPLKEEDKQNPIAVAAGLDKPKAALNVLDYLFPVERRGMRATGMDAFLQSLAKGEDYGTMARNAGLQVVNTMAQPFEGPPVRFGTRLAFGQEPYLFYDRNRKEYRFAERTPYGTPGGLEGAWERTKLALKGMNPAAKAFTEEKKSIPEYVTQTVFPRLIYQPMPRRGQYVPSH